MAKKKDREETNHETNGKPKRKVTLAKFMENSVAMELHDEKAEELLPNLWDHMRPHYDGLTITRMPGSIRIGVEGGYYRISISMPTEKRETVLVVDSLVGIIEALERYLAMGTQVYKPIWEKNKKKLPTIDDLI